MSTEKKFRVDVGIETPEIVFPDGTTQNTAYTLPTQYGFLNEMTNSSDGNRVDGEAVLVDSGGNTYVSYTYYDNNDSKRYGGIVKFDNTGLKLYSVNIIPADPDGEYSRITSLEYSTINSTDYVVAIGYYYNNVTSRDVGFMCMINPDNGSTGTMYDTLAVANYGVNLNDSVFGIDSIASSEYSVLVGNSYSETLTKTFTPLAGSTTNKLFISWSEFNASGVLPGEQVIYNVGGYYPVNVNSAISVIASIDGTSNTAPYMYFDMSYTQAGEYVILGVGSWGGNLYDWPSPVTLKVLGSNLGGVDSVNDFTFDFDPVVFNNDGNNINIAVSNKQGTPISDVYCQTYNGFDWSTEVGNPLSFDYYLNNQGYIARIGTNNNWGKSLGTSNYEKFNSVVVDGNDNIYAVGTYYDNISRSGLVVKYDVTGAQQWAVYIDPSDNLGIEVHSVDLLSDGNLICVADDAIVTKIDYTDGSIIWQVKITDNMSWDSDFKGTATPNGDYIFTNYEDNNDRLYVMCVSGVDGSVMWTKEIKRYFVGSNGDIYPQNYFQAQYIDCNNTHVSIGATTYLYFNNNSTYAGLTINFPSDGSNTDGTYGQYIISSYTFNWETKATTSVNATLSTLSSSISLGPSSPTSSNSNLSIDTTIIGEGPAQPYSLKNGDNTLFLDSGSPYVYWQVGSSNVALAGIRSNTEFLLDSLGGNVVISANDSNEWTFDTTGNLSTPGSITVNGNISAYTLTGDGTNISNIQFANINGLGNIATANLDGNSSNVFYGNGVFAAISTGSNTGNVTFNDVTVTGVNGINLSTGTRTFSVIQEGGNPGVNGAQTITVQTAYSPNATLIQNGWTVTGNNLVGITSVTNVNEYSPGFFEITTDTTETNPFWYNDVYTFASSSNLLLEFNNLGNLTIPGNVILNGIISGNGASPAPILTGFESVSAVSLLGEGGGISNVNAVTVDVLNTNGLTTVFYPTFVEDRVNNQIVRADVDLTYRSDTNTMTVGNLSASGDVNASNFIGTGTNVNITAGSFTSVFDNTGNVTFPGNISAINLGNVSAINLDGNASNILYGNGSFAAAPSGGSSYSNSNATALLASFGSNTISTTGKITGDGGGLSNVPYSNVTGLGNIVTINKDGNASNILYGNGVFAAAPSSGGSNYNDSNVATFLASFGSNTITTTGNISVGNISVASILANANISTTGYFISGNQATGGFQLGNSNSRLKAGDSNSYMTMGQNPSIFPDTTANPSAGVLIGGSGYLLGNNGSRCITLNYGGSGGVVGLNSNLQVGTSGTGTVLVPGTVTTGVNSILAGPTFTPLPNTMAGFVSNINNYTQLTIQNKSTGTDATTDFIATADNGSDTVNYLDVGIINSGYDTATPTNSLGNIVYAADSYIYAQGNASATSQSGGNLAIGTTVAGKTVKFFAGGANSSAIVATIANTGASITGNLTVSGNVVGSTANVTLVAGSYSSIFDNLGNVTLPGNVTVNGSFGIKTPNLPSFRVYGSVSTSIASGTTIKSTNGVTVDYNQGSYYDNTTGIFTAPVAGLYHCFGTIRVGTNNGLNQAAIIKNGTTLSGANTISFWETDTNTGTATHFPLTGYAKCAVGDTLRLYVVAGNVQFDSNDNWGVTYIG